MHTTASSLVAIAQYFWRIRTSLFFVYQQKFNIDAVNDYPLIRLEIRIRIVAADSIRDSIRTEISDSQVPIKTADDTSASDKRQTTSGLHRDVVNLINQTANRLYTQIYPFTVYESLMQV